jgi:hypothetical protein
VENNTKTRQERVLCKKEELRGGVAEQSTHIRVPTRGWMRTPPLAASKDG